MSALKTTVDQPTLAGRPTAHDEARALLGRVMGFVAVTVGFSALGAYLGRDLNGAIGLVLFIGAFACIVGLNIAAANTAMERPSRDLMAEVVDGVSVDEGATGTDTLRSINKAHRLLGYTPDST